MNYHLKDNNSKNETGINLCVRIDGKLFKYATGKKVNPNNWDFKTKKARRGQANYTTLNEFLKQFQKEFESLVLSHQKRGKVSFEDLRHDLDNVRGKSRTTKLKIEELDFSTIWTDHWVESLKINSEESTIKKKGYVLNCLKDFERETKYALKLENINEVFAEKFKVWALNTKKKNGENRFKKDNAIHKYIGITKEFMKWCNKRGYTTNKDYTLISGYNEVYYAPFALEAEDISNLMNIDFESIDLTQFEVRPCNIERTKKSLEATRDAFIFRSLCGIRFSDYSALSPNKFKDNRLTLVTQKTGTDVTLTLPPTVIQLLEKYNFNVPKFHNQNENENLKLLCQIAGFKEDITITYKLGGSKKTEVKKRWELVTTHTARKTFITNCLRAKIDAYLVMEIVGIKKEATFRRYIQVTNKDVAGALSKLDEYYS